MNTCTQAALTIRSRPLLMMPLWWRTWHVPVHIPAGAVPAGCDDKTFTVYDSSTNTWNSFGGFHWTSDNTATVSQGPTNLSMDLA